MIVITRNGKTTVLTGWKAGLAGAALVAATWLALVFLVFLWVGAAVTLGVILLLALPALLIVAILQAWLGRQGR